MQPFRNELPLKCSSGGWCREKHARSTCGISGSVRRIFFAFGVHQARALRDWCDETLAALQKSGKVRDKRKGD
jgi:hypothetical protein